MMRLRTTMNLQHKCSQMNLKIWKSLSMLDALSGWVAHKKMRVAATIGVHIVFTLIDSGSTYSFICQRMAEVMRLPALPTKSFTVKVATGEQLQCQDRFDKGIQWLEILGSVICNWKKLTMDFTWDNQPRQLVGVNGLPIETASFKEISKVLRPEATALALCMSIGQHTAPIPNKMQELLSQFQDVFSEVTGLPPQREIDHCINLKEGTEPINVRLYRYAHFQKE